MQNTSRYNSVIRRHVDMEMIRWRIERSGVAYTEAELLRDLLLLCTNAVVYYPKSSPEAIAAIRLREMVVKEIDSHFQKPASLPPPPSALDPPATTPPVPPAVEPPPKVKSNRDIGGSLLEKSNSSMIACRKRSSITAMAAAAPKADREERPDPPPPKEEVDDDSQAKKKTKERTLLKGARGVRNDKGVRGGLTPAKNAGELAKRSRSVSPAPKEIPSVASGKVDKKRPMSGPVRKRGGHATSLAPAKRASRAEETLLESLKAVPSSGARPAELKKPGRVEFRKDKEKENNDQGVRAKQLSSAELSLPLKRSVGRPPKRSAPPPTTSPPAKRTREDAAAPPSKPTPSKPPPALGRKRGKK